LLHKTDIVLNIYKRYKHLKIVKSQFIPIDLLLFIFSRINFPARVCQLLQRN